MSIFVQKRESLIPDAPAPLPDKTQDYKTSFLSKLQARKQQKATAMPGLNLRPELGGDGMQISPDQPFPPSKSSLVNVVTAAYNLSKQSQSQNTYVAQQNPSVLSRLQQTERDVLLIEKKNHLSRLREENAKLSLVLKSVQGAKASFLKEMSILQMERSATAAQQNQHSLSIEAIENSSLSPRNIHRQAAIDKDRAQEVYEKLRQLVLKCKSNQLEVFQIAIKKFEAAEIAFLNKLDFEFDEAVSSLEQMASFSPGNVYAAQRICSSLHDAVAATACEIAAVKADEAFSRQQEIRLKLLQAAEQNIQGETFSGANFSNDGNDSEEGSVVGDKSTSTDGELIKQNRVLMETVQQLKKENTVLRMRLMNSSGNMDAKSTFSTKSSSNDGDGSDLSTVLVIVREYVSAYLQKNAAELLKIATNTNGRIINYVLQEISHYFIDKISASSSSMSSSTIISQVKQYLGTEQFNTELAVQVSLLLAYAIKKQKRIDGARLNAEKLQLEEAEASQKEVLLASEAADPSESTEMDKTIPVFSSDSLLPQPAPKKELPRYMQLKQPPKQK